MPLPGHDGARRGGQQLLRLDEPDAAEQPESLVVSRDVLDETPRAGHGRVVGPSSVGRDEDVESPEALGAGPLEQRETRLGIGGEQCGGVRRERGSDRRLEPALDLESLEDQPSSLGREGARRGRDPLPLLQRALERREPVTRGARALGEIVALVAAPRASTAASFARSSSSAGDARPSRACARATSCCCADVARELCRPSRAAP